MRGLNRLRNRGYHPARFWEGRAAELVNTYDHPEDWPQRGWMRQGAEETTVPRLLREAGAETVLVIGAGSGRQYAYLDGFTVSGIDISPTLVNECRRRYPHIATRVADVTAGSLPPADAVVSSGVLQHVAPDRIGVALEAVKAAAGKIVVVRESVRLTVDSPYQFAHDYTALMSPWQKMFAEATDERDVVTVELAAFVK